MCKSKLFKRISAAILSLLMIFGSMPLTGLSQLGVFDFDTFFASKASAASVSNLTFQLNGDMKSYYIIECDESANGSLTIPSIYDGLPVTCIGTCAFWGCTALTSVTIGDSVTEIGSHAFTDCTGLTDVTIPDSVTSIGMHAFDTCTGLTSVTIGNGVTSIGDSAFHNCTGLTSVTIPDSVTSIGYGAFMHCTGLTDVTIPNSVTSIGDSAFHNCTGLTSVKIPDSVTSIGYGAFMYCEGLTDVTIPNSVTSMGDSAFCRCIGLTSVAIGNGITGITENAFCGCTGLTSVTIPNSVTSIGESAFYGCTGLTSVTIPNSVTSIDENVFGGCRNLADVYYSGTENEWNNISIDFHNDYLTNARIHYSVTDSTNHWSETFKDSTCKEEGMRVLSCECGYIVSEKIAKKNHSSSDWITDTAATCTQDGSKHKECTECGEILENATISPTGHTWADATCTLPKTCSKCGTTTGSALGHSYSSTVTKEPICTETGVKTFTCSRCSHSYTETIAATGHTSSGWITDKAATASAAGSRHKECTVCGEVLETATIPQLKPSTPKLGTPSNTSTGVKVAWSKVDGADNYTVYRKDGNNAYKAIASGLTGTSYTDKTAKSGTKYTYTVRGVNEAGYGTYDATGKSITYLSMPKLSSVTNVSGGVTVKWSKVTGTKGYYVYRKTGNGGWSKIADVTTTSYTDKSAKSGTTYAYTVKAYNGKTVSAYNTTGVSIKYLAMPKLTSVTNVSGGVTFKWGKVTGASGYYVYRKSGSGDWKKIANISGNSKVSYTDKSVKSGTTYKYSVRAYNGKTVSALNSTGLSIKYLATPTLNSVSSAKAGVTVKWSKVTGASGYYVYRKTGNGDYKKIATVSGNSKVSYLDKSAKKGTTYTYTVKAYSGKSVSAYNTTGLKVKAKY